METESLPAWMENTFRTTYRASCALLKRDGYLMPVGFFFKLDPEKEVLVPAGPIVGMQMPDSDRGKNAMALTIKKMGYRCKAEFLMLVQEAWCLEYPKEKVNRLNPESIVDSPGYVRPSQSPNRKEVVIFTFQWKGRGAWSMMAHMQRDEDKKPSLPEEMPTPSYMGLDIHGRFTGLLDYAPENPTPFELGESDKMDYIPGIGTKMIG